jgi:hypothetical protein
MSWFKADFFPSKISWMSAASVWFEGYALVNGFMGARLLNSISQTVV